MRLSQEEIEACLEQHQQFYDDYLDDECVICYSYKSLFGGKHPGKIKKESFSEAITMVSPNREIFFKTIAELYPELTKKRMLEIGVANGANSERMVKCLKPLEIVLIDPWESTGLRAQDRGDSQETHTAAYKEAKRRLENHSLVKTELIQAFAEEVVDNYEDESFDFIYIDGDHSYEGCKKDLDMWYPKLRKGGFFGGHDFTGNWNSMFNKGYGVQKAVCEFLDEQNKKLQIITPCVESRGPKMILPFDWGFIK